jgi:hypothetical protein
MGYTDCFYADGMERKHIETGQHENDFYPSSNQNLSTRSTKECLAKQINSACTESVEA